MKRIFQIILVVIIPMFTFSQEVNSNQLEKKSGIYYVKGESSPYTGTAITYTNGNQKANSTEYISGFPNGTLTGWYPDGSKQVEGKIIGLSKIGKWIAWYQNGNKIREGDYINNKEDGLFTWWFENGNINKKGSYKDGIAIGRWEWYFENGTLKQIGDVKGETNLGKWEDYYEDGSPKNEGDFKDGEMEGVWFSWDVNGVKTSKTYKNGLLQSNNPDLDSYVEKTQYFIEERDFKNSLLNIQKAIETVSDKTENNPEYMNLVALHSKVYSLFSHLDDAERVILKATGIPQNDVETIIKSVAPKTHLKLIQVAEKIDKSSIYKTHIAPHIALSLVYNILGDSINLRKEQQLMMERSNSSDWVITNSMALYGIRASKEEGYGIINEILNEIKVDGENYKNQLQLTYYLSLIGRFEEAEKITNKYLAENSNDIGFLKMKMNIEMSKGNTISMKELEKKILKINPKALE